MMLFVIANICSKCVSICSVISATSSDFEVGVILQWGDLTWYQNNVD